MRGTGIRETVGASVSDLESAAYVLNSPLYSLFSFPTNKENQHFQKSSIKATKKRLKLLLLIDLLIWEKTRDKSEAFRFILQKKFNGFILTGTKSLSHLQENYTAFREAINNL